MKTFIVALNFWFSGVMFFMGILAIASHTLVPSWLLGATLLCVALGCLGDAFKGLSE